jgi:anti-sigma B factor antagonist
VNGVQPVPGTLTVDVKPDATGVVVTVDGDLDMATTRILTARTDEIAADWGAEVTLDLAGVGFCDSLGISVLVRLRQRCDERGWIFRVINVQPAVRRTLVDFSGLGDYLNIIS